MSRGELFGSLCATVFLVNLARVVFAPLLQPVAADFQVTVASLGLVTSAAWMGSAAPRLPTGYVLTRVPRHRVVAVTGALLVATSAFTGLADSVAHLAVGAFLMGLSSGIYFVAANPLVSELFPERVSRAIGVHGMSSQLAAVAAPLVVEVVLLIADWRTTFFGVAMAAAASTVLLVYAARWTEIPAAGAGDRSLVAAARSQWRVVLTGVVFIGGVSFLWNGLFNLYGDYVAVTKGLSPATGRLLLSLMFAAGVPAFLLTGRLAERFRTLPLLFAFTGTFVGSVLVLTAVEGVLAVALLSLAAGYSFFSIPPALDTYLLTSLPDAERASAYSLYSATMMLFHAVGSGTVGAAVVAGVSYTTVFRALAVAVAAVAAGLFAFHLAGRLPTRGAAAA